MDTAPVTEPFKCRIAFDRPRDDTLRVLIAGSCRVGVEIPSVGDVEDQLRAVTGIRRITFDAKDLDSWDSGLLIFLKKVFDHCRQSDLVIDFDGLPSGVKRLLTLASSVPERKGARKKFVRVPFLEQVGQSALDLRNSMLEMLGFIGEACMAYGK